MKTILCVDDEPTQLTLLRLALTRAGFRVLEADDGQTGVEMTMQHQPDLIIMDLMMPGMDGMQVCHEIRSFSQVPILILSVVDKPNVIAQALDEGADDYLVKPVPGGVLIAHINTLSRRNRPEAFARSMQVQARLR